MRNSKPWLFLILPAALLSISCGHRNDEQAKYATVSFTASRQGATADPIYADRFTATAPSTVSGFSCLLINVTGGSVATTSNVGLVSSTITVSQGGTVSVQVPLGGGYTVQVIGLLSTIGCPASMTASALLSTSSFPLAVVLGSVTTSILNDTSVTVRSTYSQATAMDFRSGSAPSPVKRIYVTALASQVRGNIGISGADNLCNTDTNKPNTSTYKALIADGTTRRACTTANCAGGTSENIAWPLLPFTSYVRADGTTPLGTTNSGGVFTFPLTNAFTVVGTNLDSYTGLNNNWTTSANTCSGWSNNTAGVSGAFGVSNDATTNAINNSTTPCNNLLSMICAEQ